METMMTTTLAIFGAGIAGRGLWRERSGLRGPVTDPATGGAYVRALRSVLAGGALIAIALGWAFDLPAVLTLGLVIGAEEMLEIGVVIAAMNDAERRPDACWRFRPIRTARSLTAPSTDL